MGRACSAHGGDEKCVHNLFGKPEWKRLRGRPRRRSEDNIKLDLNVNTIVRIVSPSGLNRLCFMCFPDNGSKVSFRKLVLFSQKKGLRKSPRISITVGISITALSPKPSEHWNSQLQLQMLI